VTTRHSTTEFILTFVAYALILMGGVAGALFILHANGVL
jgi:hypothetical protein